jgi:hypothetical protein
VTLGVIDGVGVCVGLFVGVGVTSKILINEKNIINEILLYYKNNVSTDVVYKVENNKAFVVGGNLGNSIGLKEINLDNDYITKSTEIGNYKILVKKTNKKYYKSKNLIGTGIDVSTNDGIIATGPSADYWSLVAVCALENDTDQGRCDVAQ